MLSAIPEDNPVASSVDCTYSHSEVLLRLNIYLFPGLDHWGPALDVANGDRSGHPDR